MKKIILVLSIIFFFFSCWNEQVNNNNVLTKESNIIIDNNINMVENEREKLIFNKLKDLDRWYDSTIDLPSLSDIRNLEKEYNIKLPHSYFIYLFQYSDLSVWTYELYMLNAEKFLYIDFHKNILDARSLWLPDNYFPFMTDNWSYLCFDLNTNIESNDYNVVYWSNSLMFKEERWGNFLDWVEDDWIPNSIN